MADADYLLRLETEAARQLLAALKGSGDADDEEIVESAIEGETNLIEAVAAVLDEIDREEALVRGLESKEEDFAARRERIKARIERQRALIEQAMIMTEREKILLPTATLSLRKLKPGVVIDEEADIPSDFWKVHTEMKLDKKALKAALDGGKIIDGAHLDNGGVGLQVRRK